MAERCPDKTEVEGPIPSSPTKNMLTKIDKKVLTILIIALVSVLLICFAVYKYLSQPVVKVQNSAGAAQTESQNQPINK